MTTGEHDGGTLGEARIGRELRVPRAAGVAGLVFSTLLIVALLMLRGQPAADSSADEIADWYLQSRARHLAIVGLYVVPFAGIAFLWFMAVIRSHIGNREDQFFATVFIGSGLLFVAMMFAGAAAVGAPIASVKFQHTPAPSPEVIGYARSLGYTLLYIYAVRVAAVFMIAVSTIGIRTERLPRWLAFLGYALAAVMLLSVSFFEIAILFFPLWVGAVSLVILFTSPATDAPVTAAPTAAGR